MNEPRTYQSGPRYPLGYISIRRKNIQAHRACMLAAFGTSTLFLICYLSYHYLHGTTRFAGQGRIRAVYLGLLTSHTVLAGTVVPLALMTL